MKIRNFLTLGLLIAALSSVHGQYREQQNDLSGSSFSDRIYFGGGGGFSGGTGYINIAVSPLVGYKFTQAFSGGMEFTYQFINFTQADVSWSNYGGGPFLRYNIIPKLFAYSQYEYLNFGSQFSEQRLNFNSLFVGLGYTEPIGNNFAFNITALYNVLYNDGANSPYRSPVQFRVGFVAGLF